MNLETPVKTWKERIEEAYQRGSFTNDDKRTAAFWSTRAAPQEQILFTLEDLFYKAVRGQEIWNAQQLYDAIQVYFNNGVGDFIQSKKV